MNLPILSHIATTVDRAYMLEKLAVLEAGAFSTKKSYQDNVHTLFSLVLAESLLQTGTESGLVESSPESIQKFLRSLQDQIKALPEVRVRLAINPTDDLLRAIAKSFDTFTGGKVVLSYSVDPLLLGGVVIEWNGRYLDYSLKKRLSELVHAQFKG